jgi:uncharacterized membrane protein
MVAIFMFAAIGCSGSQSTFQTKAKKLSAVKDSDGREHFVFNTSDFPSGRVNFYSVNHNGTDIRFFMVRAQDGIVRAAFDACDVCFREQRGYILQGDFMICVNCGMRFRLDRINHASGGCNPSPLARAFDGDRIIIYKDDVVKGVRYF